jgi:hypothetical protein
MTVDYCTELRHLYSLPNIIRVIKSRTGSWAVHVPARKRQVSNAYITVLTGRYQLGDLGLHERIPVK